MVEEQKSEENKDPPEENSLPGPSTSEAAETQPQESKADKPDEGQPTDKDTGQEKEPTTNVAAEDTGKEPTTNVAAEDTGASNAKEENAGGDAASTEEYTDEDQEDPEIVAAISNDKKREPTAKHTESAIVKDAPIIEAIKSGDINAVNKLVKKHSLKVWAEDGETPLMKALAIEDYVKRLEMVKVLIRHGVKVNQRSRTHGFTPIFKAIEMGDRLCIQCLVKAGAKTDIRAFNGTPTVMFACGDIKLLKWLIKKVYCQPNERAEQCDGSMLFQLLQFEGDKLHEHVQTLLECGANLYHRDYTEHKSFLQIANEKKLENVVKVVKKYVFKLVEEQNVERLRFEIHRSALLSSLKNDQGRTIQEAVKETENEQLTALLDKESVKAIHAAIEDAVKKAEDGNADSLRQCYEQANLDPNCLSKDGLNPLHRASANNHKEVVEYLLAEVGVDIDLQDGQYCRTPLHYAAGEGQVDMIAFLLQRGAKAYAEDTNGMTALEYASYCILCEDKDFDLREAVDAFVAGKYDLNRIGTCGTTILHDVSTFSKPYAEHVISKGADPRVLCQVDGKTAAEQMESTMQETTDEDRKAKYGIIKDFLLENEQRVNDRERNKNAQVKEKKSSSCTIL